MGWYTLNVSISVSEPRYLRVYITRVDISLDACVCLEPWQTDLEGIRNVRIQITRMIDKIMHEGLHMCIFARGGMTTGIDANQMDFMECYLK